MKVTWFGTTTLLFDDGRDQVLFDCHVTRPSIPRYLFGQLRTDAALADRLIERHHIDRLRAIFVSHAHHDHVMDAPFFALRCGAAIYGSPSALNVGRGGGVPEDRLRPFGDPDIIGGFEVTALPSLHSKPTLFNNDLGQTIDRPVAQPARKRNYKEGRSWDFVVRHSGRTYVIRPSFNYIEEQLDGVCADVLFLGVSGLSKADAATRARFFAETVDKVRPHTVIPIHWDDFFSPLAKPVRGMPRFIEDTGRSLRILGDYCGARGINCLVQLPLTSVELSSPSAVVSQENEMTRLEAQRAIDDLRAEAKTLPEMSLDEINAEISAARLERKSRA
ncbi:MAG: MBL fold metallo-hydrolase [Clostridia bacterium]|nr:MBL fold metallo-hydrolase [Clostridia bacterium]